MDVTTITDFFYQKASKRIKIAVEKSGLNRISIYKPDHKQISRIINNNRTKNNPFLINEAVLLNTYKDEETGEYIPCGLLETLDFNSKSEILWGTDEEIKSYLHELFIKLWSVLSEEPNSVIDTESYLYDYVPYAKYSAYWNILFPSDSNGPRFFSTKLDGKKLGFLAITHGIYEDTVIENIDTARNEALMFLYARFKDNFLNEFLKFTSKTLSFHKLDKVIKESFINELFIPMIKRYKPNTSSLGLRVKDLILEDLSYVAPLVNHKEIDNPDYHRKLINASSNYIVELENIQKSFLPKKRNGIDWN